MLLLWLLILISFYFPPNQEYDQFIGLTVLLQVYYSIIIYSPIYAINELSQTLLKFMKPIGLSFHSLFLKATHSFAWLARFLSQEAHLN